MKKKNHYGTWNCFSLFMFAIRASLFILKSCSKYNLKLKKWKMLGSVWLKFVVISDIRRISLREGVSRAFLEIRSLASRFDVISKLKDFKGAISFIYDFRPLRISSSLYRNERIRV